MKETFDNNLANRDFSARLSNYEKRVPHVCFQHLTYCSRKVTSARPATTDQSLQFYYVYYKIKILFDHSINALVFAPHHSIESVFS